MTKSVYQCIITKSIKIIVKKLRIVVMNKFTLDDGTPQLLKAIYMDKPCPLWLEFCGHDFCLPSYNITRGTTYYYAIEYVISGSGYIRENDAICNPCKGDTFVLHPGSGQILYADSSNPWEKLWIIFYGPLADVLFESYDLKKRILYKNLNIEKQLMDIFKIYDSETLTKHEIQSKCSTLIFDIIQQLYLYECDDNFDIKNCSVADKLKILIDNTPFYPVSLNDLSKKMYCSRDHAIHLFTEKFKISPYKYMSQHRLKAIQQMLASSTIPINDIAKTMGFCDSGYFATWFKKRTGMTPSKYRKTHNK